MLKPLKNFFKLYSASFVLLFKRGNSMAKITLKSYIKSIHGRTGDLIWYNVKGNQYVRSYTHPCNPRTEAQQRNRATFAEAVKLWQCLSVEEKSLYNRMAEGKPHSGYNFFISLRMKGVTLKLPKRFHSGENSTGRMHATSMKAGSSVSPPLLLAAGSLYLRRVKRVLKKPPGGTAIAA